MPGGNPYRPMYGGGPMQQPGMMPNMPQMRGPGGAAPYYPGAPGGMHYPPNSGYGGNMPGQGNMEEGDHGYRGGRGNPGGRGGRGRRNKRAPSGGGRGGRSSYHNNNSHQQNNPGNQNQQGEVDGSSNKLQEVKNDGGGTEKVTSSTPANAASD
jgi:translation initiation factor IF-2